MSGEAVAKRLGADKDDEGELDWNPTTKQSGDVPVDLSEEFEEEVQKPVSDSAANSLEEAAQEYECKDHISCNRRDIRGQLGSLNSVKCKN